VTARARYAIYFAPEVASEWWRRGCHWLGRDAATDRVIEQPEVTGVSHERFRTLTDEPRKYGFHATLKAPFHLRAGLAQDALITALRRFCSARVAFLLPTLTVARLDDFVALVPTERDSRIDELAAECVRAFDAFRAPLAAHELERRRRATLSKLQQQYLQEWGYPYVLAEFRFHMTLTGSLAGAPTEETEAVVAAASAMFGELNATPMHIDAICLFEQVDVMQPFRRTMRCPFGGGSR
jgi:putative phosphonate metabolism protein